MAGYHSKTGIIRGNWVTWTWQVLHEERIYKEDALLSKFEIVFLTTKIYRCHKILYLKSSVKTCVTNRQASLEKVKSISGTEHMKNDASVVVFIDTYRVTLDRPFRRSKAWVTIGGKHLIGWNFKVEMLWSLGLGL